MSRVHELSRHRTLDLIAIYHTLTSTSHQGQSTRWGYSPTDWTRDQIIAAIINNENQPKDTQ